MTVLGIDPSLCNTGIAPLELYPTGECVVETLVVRTTPSAGKRGVLVADDDARRVTEIAAAVDAAITGHEAVALVIEAPAGSKGARAARALALAFAAVVSVARLRGTALCQVQPGDVKWAMCGRKDASKGDVVLAVERRYSEVQWPAPASVVEHAADAIGAVVAALDSDTLRLARSVTGGRGGAPGETPPLGPASTLNAPGTAAGFVTHTRKTA